jgi:tyrosine-specific transport protein
MFAYLYDRKFLHASAVLVGTMIGAGIYGIPFAFAKAGFLVGIAWLVGLAVLICLFNLMFAELTLSTQGVHQVSGYANIWLGAWGRRLMTVANLLGLYGSLLAYMIVAGEFLHNVLSQFLSIDPQLYCLLFASVLSLLWVLRTRTIASIELGLIALYGAIILIIAAVGLPHLNVSYLSDWTPDFWYLPYGIVFFALAGVSAIPIQRQLLAGRERLFRPAIVVSMIFVVVLYALFALTVVGLTGDITTPEALAGLFGVVSTPVIMLASFLGILTISSSYVMLGTALYETFHIDYHVRPSVAWLMGLAPPVIFYLSGLRTFIDVIGLVGAVAGGTQAVLLLAAYIRSRRMKLRAAEFRMRIPTVVVWLLMAFFAAGVIHEFMVR